MGKILNILNKSGDNVEVTLDLSLEELKFLKGNIENIRLFSEFNLKYKSKVVCRGNLAATNYFLIPKEINDGINFDDVSCCMIPREDKNLFVFGVSKF